MKLNYFKRVVGVAFIATTALLYQNCGKGFSADLMQESLSLSLSTPDIKHEDVHITSTSSQTNINSDLEFIIQAEKTSLQGLNFQWSHTLNGVLNACSVKSQDNSSNYIINCPQAGTLAIAAKVIEGTISTVLPSYGVAVVSPPPANEELSLTVSFDIPDGTRATPWNTEATVVETFIGQTLKINNKDSVTHQLHTNGRPCGHGAPIAVGSSVNCAIGSAYNYKTDGIVYDHILGTKRSDNEIKCQSDEIDSAADRSHCLCIK